MPDPKVPEMVERVYDKLSEFDLDGASGFYEEELLKATLAIITAMRTPTKAMLYAAAPPGGDTFPSTVRAYWQAMIDSALKE